MQSRVHATSFRLQPFFLSAAILVNNALSKNVPVGVVSFACKVKTIFNGMKIHRRLLPIAHLDEPSVLSRLL